MKINSFCLEGKRYPRILFKWVYVSVSGCKTAVSVEEELLDYLYVNVDVHQGSALSILFLSL